MKVLATWCVRHRVVVVLLWLAALVGMTLISQSVGTAYSNNFPLPNTESTKALDLLQAAAPSVPVTGSRSSSTPPTGPRSPTPRSRPASTHAGQGEGRAPRHRASSAPTSPLGAAQVSEDGQTAFATVTFDKQAQYLSTPWPSSSWPRPRRPTAPICRWRWPGQWPSTPTGSPSAAPARRAPGRHRAAAWSSARSSPWCLPLVLGPGLAGHRHRRDRPAQPRPEDARVLDRAGPAHRARRRRRLRPVHRHPPPTGPGRRPGRRVVHRQRRQHLGPGRAVRRDHRVHRPARHVRPRRLVPLRPGHRRRHRRVVHHDRRAHPAARPARLHRAAGPERQPAKGPGRQRTPHRRRRHQGLLAPLGGLHPEAPGPAGRRWP